MFLVEEGLPEVDEEANSDSDSDYGDEVVTATRVGLTASNSFSVDFDALFAVASPTATRKVATKVRKEKNGVSSSSSVGSSPRAGVRSLLPETVSQQSIMAGENDICLYEHMVAEVEAKVKASHYASASRPMATFSSASQSLYSQDEEVAPFSAVALVLDLLQSVGVELESADLRTPAEEVFLSVLHPRPSNGHRKGRRDGNRKMRVSEDIPDIYKVSTSTCLQLAVYLLSYYQ